MFFVASVLVNRQSQPPGARLASWYAKKLGIPVAMANKVGRPYKPPTNEINGFFPGLYPEVASSDLMVDGAYVINMSSGSLDFRFRCCGLEITQSRH